MVPAHSFKFAAALQAAQAGDAPVLIRIETKAGHGAGKPTAKLIEEAADRWGFLTRALKMERTGQGRRAVSERWGSYGPAGLIPVLNRTNISMTRAESSPLAPVSLNL